MPKCCSIASSNHHPPHACSSSASTTAAPPPTTGPAASSDCHDGNRNCHKAARSPCSWLRSTARELPPPEMRHRCRSLVARIGSGRWRQGHAAAAASEFGSDPMSYALHFEDDRSPDSDEEFPARNFLARLPESPDWLLPGKLPREVVACS